MTSSVQPLDDDLFTFLAHYAVVPAAVIAMVASLLWYLVDVRSAYLGGGPQLKWIGFCFAVATVLIERYGHTQGDRELQGCYTAALGIATVLVMLAEPWETRAVGLGEKVANLLIIAAVWRFATKVTQGLSPEEGRPAWTGLRLYGVERLRAEAWQREKGTQPAKKAPPAPPPNPAVSVGRLAALALLGFALGEPVLLNAAPQTGIRALAAVVIFLFSTGIVLAAGSSLDSLRRAEWAGGQVSPLLVPGRLALAGGLLVLVLAAALAVPGLQFRGTGRLRPPVAHGEGAEADRGYQEADRAGNLQTHPPQEGPSQRGSQSEQAEEARGERDARDSSAALTGPAAALVRTLTTLGKWLIVPLVLALILAGLWALARLWPQLAGWRSRMADRWRNLLRRFAGLFKSRPKRSAQKVDPLANLEALAGLPPRETVLAAYLRFLEFLESLGSPRPAKSTPYEVLHGLPASLRYLEDPARTLTELYVQAAYADEPVEEDSGLRAIVTLKGLRGLRPAGG
ncbi:MAG TPA: DUF4129 domain-containing protein [Thermoanaerobaculia bacterium]|nr:DUF4129 domain-containing protein [Thermoanaerobaculia bacterium]